MDSPDLTPLLNDWPLEAGRINARLIAGRDGRQLLQVRIELGVLQMELEGRPDGQKPHGKATLLEHHQHRLQRYIAQTGLAVGFALSEEDCRDLRQEAVQFYHRYVALFSIARFDLVVRDTLHNLAVLDLCRDHAANQSDRTILEQFRPQIVMMRSRAEAEQAVKDNRPKHALAALDRGIDELRAILAEMEGVEDTNQSNEIMLLRGMRDALVPKLPSSQRAELEERLRAALDAENYELAAILRDELRMLK